jgi:hypothetical protein
MFKEEAKGMFIYLTVPILVLLIVILIAPRISSRKDVPSVYNHFRAFIVLPKAYQTYYDIQESGAVQLG